MINISICLSDIPAKDRKQGKNGKEYVKQAEVIENKEVTKSEPITDDGQLPF